ncbi:MAG: hypothetical protein K8T25_08365 [Planctomycetia bacterium]|nr:hypothetical protein [Planctomycetia bacterium]
MFIKRIATLLCALAGLIVFSSDSSAGPETNTTGGPPELGVSVAVDGHTLEIRRFVVRMVTRTTTADLPPGVKIEVKEGSIGPSSSTEVVPVVEMHITQVDATKVVARRIDGRAVSYKVLMDELVKPTPIVFLKQGQQLDPVFLTMFKPESLLLVLPSSTPSPSVVPNNVAPTIRLR